MYTWPRLSRVCAGPPPRWLSCGAASGFRFFRQLAIWKGKSAAKGRCWMPRGPIEARRTACGERSTQFCSGRLCRGRAASLGPISISSTGRSARRAIGYAHAGGVRAEGPSCGSANAGDPCGPVRILPAVSRGTVGRSGRTLALQFAPVAENARRALILRAARGHRGCAIIGQGAGAGTVDRNCMTAMSRPSTWP